MTLTFIRQVCLVRRLASSSLSRFVLPYDIGWFAMIEAAHCKYLKVSIGTEPQIKHLR